MVPETFLLPFWEINSRLFTGHEPRGAKTVSLQKKREERKCENGIRRRPSPFHFFLSPFSFLFFLEHRRRRPKTEKNKNAFFSSMLFFGGVGLPKIVTTILFFWKRSAPLLFVFVSVKRRHTGAKLHTWIRRRGEGKRRHFSGK